MKYCFHLSFWKASKYFILDWLRYKRISVEHFTVIPWWCKFGFKAPALCRGPSEWGRSISLQYYYPSGAEAHLQSIIAYSSCTKSPQLVLPSPLDSTTALDLSSTNWKVSPVYFTNVQPCLKTLLGVAHLSVTFFLLTISKLFKNGITKANAFVYE